jgi:ATP-binding cassette subfamily B protein/subfamily B ATP-binding cassette protein MsbA
MSVRRQLSLLRYARPHWRGLLVLGSTMAATVGLSLAQPWPMKILVDQALGDRPMSSWMTSIIDVIPGPGGRKELLLLLAAATVLIFLATTVVSMVNNLVSVRVGQKMAYELGADLFRHLQRLSLLFHSRQPVGDSIARVTGDPYAVQVMVVGAILPVLQSLVMLVAMFAIMFRLDWTLTLLSIGVVPFLFLAIRIYARPMKDANRAARDLEGRMMSVVQLALNAVPAVQAFTREELEHSRYRSYADKAVVAYVRSTLAGMWFKLFVGLVTAVGTASLIYLGGLRVLDGRMTVGTLLVFLAYLAALYGPLNSLAYTAQTWQYAAARADRVMEILETAPDVEDAPDAKEVDLVGHVRYNGVTFGYERGRPVLQNVSLQADPGDVVAIVGPTGAGKTTLVNLLVRFFDPWTGGVEIDGHDLRTLKLRSLREQVGLVLQEPFIFPLTVAENIAYGRPAAVHEEIVAAAQAANAHDFICRLPDGYETVVGERGATLSGGEKQRLSIARAFLKDAPILILDEPTSALDARTEGLLLDALERLMRGRVTFIVAHRLSTIRAADQILVVDGGQIAERGRHDELVRNGGLYSILYARQTEYARHDVPAAAVADAVLGALDRSV